MNVTSTLMAVLIPAPTPMDPTTAAAEQDTDCLPMDTPVKVWL